MYLIKESSFVLNESNRATLCYQKTVTNGNNNSRWIIVQEHQTLTVSVEPNMIRIIQYSSWRCNDFKHVQGSFTTTSTMKASKRSVGHKSSTSSRKLQRSHRISIDRKNFSWHMTFLQLEQHIEYHWYRSATYQTFRDDRINVKPTQKLLIR